MLNRIIKYFLENRLVTVLIHIGFIVWGIEGTIEYKSQSQNIINLNYNIIIVHLIPVSTFALRYFENILH